MDPKLEAMRDRLVVARATHAAAVADLARLEQRARVPEPAIAAARRRVDQSRDEIIAARRALIRIT